MKRHCGTVSLTQLSKAVKLFLKRKAVCNKSFSVKWLLLEERQGCVWQGFRLQLSMTALTQEVAGQFPMERRQSCSSEICLGFEVEVVMCRRVHWGIFFEF